MDLTRPHGLVENATAPSAEGFPDGLGEGRLEAAAFSDDLELLLVRLWRADLVVAEGGATDQVLLNNPFQNCGCAGVVPDLIRVNDSDGALLADPQAIGLGAHDLWIGPAG